MDRYRKIFEHFGSDAQKRKLAEEFYELMEAITILDNTPNPDIHLHDDVISEIADVVILITQFMAFYDIDCEIVNKVIRYKLSRTEDRIKSGYYDK